jgi:hypothetical protein
MSIAEYAKKNGVACSTVRQKCLRGNIPEAVKIGAYWVIPEDAPYIDHRIKDGKFLGRRRKHRNSHAT